MKEALLYKNLSEKRAQCRVCPHYCLLLPNQRGKCGVRENKDGKIYSLVYGKAASINIDPIEKKPFFHFLPGTESLSFGTVGCNLACLNCQNWQISQSPKIRKKIEGREILPEQIVEMAIRYRCPSISYTYTEPTVFSEFALDTMKIAKKKRLKNCWVSNGFISKETLELVTPYIDAINVDIKGASEEFYKEYCKARLAPIIDVLLFLKKKKVWIEITTLAIPGAITEKDFTKIAKFINCDCIGAEIFYQLFFVWLIVKLFYCLPRRALAKWDFIAGNLGLFKFSIGLDNFSHLFFQEWQIFRN